MKNFTYVFFLLIVAVQSYGQVQVGDGKVSEEMHAPIDPYYQYSYSQSIYLASEINASGLITSIEWYYNGPGSTLLAASSPIKIYLAQSTKTEFLSDTDWVPYNGLTEVYNGPISADGPGWISLPLTTPFEYDGVNNLVVATSELNDGSDSNDDEFLNTQVEGNRTLLRFDPWDPVEVINPIPALYMVNYVPDIVFGGITEQCSVPIKLTASAITSSSATVTWNVPMAITAGSEYYISILDIDPDVLTSPTGSIASGNSVNINSGLIPATPYYIWARNICNGVPGDWSYPGSFITACVPVTSFTENFDNTEPFSLPSCWSAIKANGANSYASVYVRDYQPYSPNNAVQMYNSSSPADANIILVTPQLSNLPDRTNRLRFFAKGETAGSLQIGTLNNNTETAIFTPFQTIATSSSYNEYSIDFTSYMGTDTYIGIRINSTVSEAIQYVDNAIWELQPLCPDITNVKVPVATPTTANISWTAGGSETQWEVAYAAASVLDPTGLSPASAAFNFADLTGLTENTPYNVWVRSSCGVNKGSWFGPVTFRTPCLPVNTFSENFDTSLNAALPDCWSEIARGNPVDEWASVETIDYMFHSAPTAVALNQGGDITNDVILVSPNLGNLADQTNRLRFYAKEPGIVEVGTLNSSTLPGTFTLFESVTTNAAGAEYTIDFTTYEGTDKFIGFRIKGGEYDGIYLDDIVWEVKPDCPDTKDVTVPEVTTSTATVIWTPGESSDWEVVYADTSVTDPGTLTPVAVSDPTITIPGLNDGAIYKVWVRSVCELNKKGNWSTPVLFTTVCLPVNAVDENFNSVETPSLPMCWSSIVRGESVDELASVTTLTDIYTLTKTVQLWNAYSGGEYDVMLVSPELGNLSFGTYRLRFKARTNVLNSIQVGTLDESTEDGTFNPIESVQITPEITEYTVEFSSYTGEDRYIGISLNSNIPGTTIFLDDIVWELSPICPSVTEIAAQATGATTAAISWSVGGGESNWQIVYGDPSVTDPSTLTASGLIDSSNTVITGLQAATTYKLWVRSVCEAPDVTGNWIGPIEFTTECTAADVNYVQDFETAAVPAIPECSMSFNAGGGNNWNTVFNPGYGLSTKALRYTYNPDNAADAWYFTQGINLVAEVPYYVSYNYVNGSPIYTEKLRVKVGQNATVDAMTELLEENEEVGSQVLHTTNVTFTPTETGVYYFGFNVYSDPGQYELYVDNIRVQHTLSTVDFDNSDLKFYPNPVDDVLNLSYTQNISNVAVYNLLGQKVMEKKTNSDSIQLDMSILSAGNYFVKVSSDNQIQTLKIIKR